MNLEQRINSLEKTVKFQRLGLLVLVASFSVSFLVGATEDTELGSASFKEVVCHEFTIVDKDGNPLIYAGPEGFSLMDDKQIPRISMGMDPTNKGFGLAMMDANGAPRIAAGTNSKGEAGISLISAGIVEVMSQKTWPSE